MQEALEPPAGFWIPTEVGGDALPIFTDDSSIYLLAEIRPGLEQVPIFFFGFKDAEPDTRRTSSLEEMILAGLEVLVTTREWLADRGGW